MPSKTTTFEATGLPDGELWSNPANWSNGIPVDGDSVILSGLGFTNGGYDDIPALSLATLTEQLGTFVNVTGSELTIGTLAGQQGLLHIEADALDAGAPVTVTVDAVSAGSGALSALGVGAMLIYQAAADQGEAFQAVEGGTIVIDAVPSSTAEYIYNAEPNETLAFKSPAATNAGAIINVAPSEVLEVPGTSVSAVIFGTNSLSVTTSAGTYAFTNVIYAAAVRGYTAAMDSATGLVAITFNGLDTFQRNVKATSGALSGDYLWSNAANWSAGVPTNGASIGVGATGYDDLASLTLASLTLNAAGNAVVHVTGGSLTVDSLTVFGSGGSAVLDADAADAGAPVTVTVQQVAAGGATLSATGAGAYLLDNSAEASAQTTDYAVAQGGLVELSDAPLTTDTFTYTSNGAFAFKNPGGDDLALFQGVGAGSTIEVPGGAVLGVTIGTNSVTIGTDLGTYAFNRVVFATPVTNHTQTVDFSTVLQAVTLRGADTFTPNANETGLARFLWSNAANWTEGVPVHGDSVLTTYYGIDDIQNLTLSGLTLSSVNNVAVEHSLTIGTLTEGTNTLVGAESDSPAAPAILTIGTIVGAPYDNVIEAQGAGATVIDRSATDLAGQGVAGLPGMQYEVNAGGTLEFLSAAPAAISQFVFLDTSGKGAGGQGTLAFGAPGATVAAALQNIAPGDVLELPGTSVSNVVFGSSSLTVTTDAGTVAFTNVTYGDPITGYTAARDPATGLVAISFTGMDVFEPNVMATSGVSAGQYLWSNAANWSDGVPISGDVVQISTSGISIDDVPNLSLAALQLGFSLPNGVSETIDGVDALGNNLTIGTLEATPGQNHPGGLLIAGGDEGLPGGGPSTVTVNAGAGGDMILEAAGVGAHVIDKTTQETGVENVRAYEISDANETETYEPLLANDTVDLLGPLILGATKPGETIAFHDPGASNPGLLENVAAGDTVEVPGTVALSVTIGTTSLTVTTDAGSYDFSNVTYSSVYPTGNYTTSVDGTTGLVAITFGPPNMFEQNVTATSGPLSGDYLWSNAANWSERVPTDGSSVIASVTGADDIAALSLSSIALSNGAQADVFGGSLSIGSVSATGEGGVLAYAGATSSATVTVGLHTTADGKFGAFGAGSIFVDQSTTDPGEYYFAADGGTTELTAAPAATSFLSYYSNFEPAGATGTFALRNPGAVIAAELQEIVPGDVLELPGTSVSAVTFGATSLSVTTSAGSYAFTNVTYDTPVTGYTAAIDQTTGLVAITFTGPDVFEQNVKATSGPLAGDYLWSNPANWSLGAPPVDGGTVTVADPATTGYDDLPALTLASLSLYGSDLYVTGRSLVVGTVTGGGHLAAGGTSFYGTLTADAADAGAPVTVTVGSITDTSIYGDTYLASGIGATFVDQSPTDEGENYRALRGGLFELGTTPISASNLTYNETIIGDAVQGPSILALESPGATTNAALTNIEPGDVLELPGTSVSAVTFGTTSLSVTTDAGIYAFTKVTYGLPVTGYTAALDTVTGLVAITFTGPDVFEPNVKLTSGPFSGLSSAFYAWSNPANWSQGVPIDGDSIAFLSAAYTLDDLPSLTLTGLNFNDTFSGVYVTGASLAVGTVTADTDNTHYSTIVADATAAGAPVSVSIGTLTGIANLLEAYGAGASLVDRSATDQGKNNYLVEKGGFLELFAAPAPATEIGYSNGNGGTVALPNAAAHNGTLFDPQPGVVLELPGTSVSALAVTATSLSVTTDSGTYAFALLGLPPITGYTAALDTGTGLVAITFTGVDTFSDKVQATSGPFAGDYLWSNAANWSDGVPIDGDSVIASVTGADDIAALSLSSLALSNGALANVFGGSLSIGSVSTTGEGGVLAYAGATSSATVTVGMHTTAYGKFGAFGAGSTFVDNSATDPGEYYFAADGGTTELTAAPAATSILLYYSNYEPAGATGTFVLRNPGAVIAADLSAIVPGDVLELPGTSVSAATFGATSLSVTTSAGTYAFTTAFYDIPVTGYTAAVDQTTGLVAITFTGVDTFSDKVQATSGPLAGDYLWSNAANWSDGVPINGDDVEYTLGAVGYDDLPAPNLSALNVYGGDAFVTGSTLTIGTLTGGDLRPINLPYYSTFTVDAADADAPVTVTVGTVAGMGGEYTARGAGASFVDQSAADPGDRYFAEDGGTVRLSATPAGTSYLGYGPGQDTLELAKPAASSDFTFGYVAPGDVLELPGNSVGAATFGANSLSVTTDAGTYAFTDVRYYDPVTGYTAAPDATTGLVAITFTGPDAFAPNVKVASGLLTGDYLWSNGANWSETAPPTSAIDAALPTGAYTTAIATGESESAKSVTIDADATLAVDGALHITNDFAVRGALLEYGPITVGGDFTIASGGTAVLRGNIVVTGDYIEGDDTTLGLGGSLTADAIDVTAGGRFTLDGGTAAGQSFDLSGGVLELASGSLDLPLTSGEYGTIQIDAGTALELSGAASSGITADFAGGAATLTLDDPAGFDGVIGGAGSGDTITFGTGGISVVSYALGGGGIGTLTLDIGGTDTAIRFADGNAYDAGNFVPGPDDGGGTTLSVNCFAAGTRIMTAAGLVAVEVLREGDIVRTHFAGAAPICWIGHRRVYCRRHPDPTLVWPVRVAAGAFGPGMPDRDLRLSPDHAVYMEDVLIPIRQLLNGTTIAQTECDNITYYHVDLGHHDVLFAEGLPAESYLDTGNRAVFENAAMPIMLHPSFSRSLKPDRAVKSCAKLMVEAERVEPIWRRLAARSATLGRPVSLPTAATDPLLRLVVADCDVAPVEVIDDRYMFVLPPRTCWATIRSRAAAPSDLRPWLDDRRRLGVSVSRIVLRSGTSRTDIPVDHPALADGWHDVELAGNRLWRWTDGGALLPVSAGTNMIEIHLSGSIEYPARLENVGRSCAVGLPLN